MTAIWHGKPTLEKLNQRGANTMAQHLDIQFTEIGDDYLVATMPVDERTKQPLGLLNGGASCALAETLGSTAANACVDSETTYCVGLEINANHLKSARTGRVKAITKPIHIGKRTQVWNIDIFSEGGAQITVCRLTMAVVQR